MSKNGMTRYIIKRVLYMFLVLFIIMTMCFILIKLLPLPELPRSLELLPREPLLKSFREPLLKSPREPLL